MSNVNPDSEFTGTCKPVKYPCNTGDYFVDPCDCHNYYWCVQETISTNTCNSGTAWDHRTTSCLKNTDIFLKGICNFEQPWYRCNQTDNITDPAAIYKIKTEICNITNGAILSTTTESQTQAPDNSSGSDAGTIAAGIVGGILAILIILIIVFVVLRKKKGKPLPDAGSIKRYMSRKRKTKLTTANSLDNPSYRQEEVYTEIDDMGDPTYQAEPSTTSLRNNHLSPSAIVSTKGSPRLPERALTDNTREKLAIQSNEDDTVYDNRADTVRSYIEVVDDLTEKNDDGGNQGENGPKQIVDAQGYLEASIVDDKSNLEPVHNAPGYYVLENGGGNSNEPKDD